MKEADLQRLFHRPPGPHALQSCTAAGNRGPHHRLSLLSMPSRLRPVPQNTDQGSGKGVRRAMQPFYQPINILGLGGAKNSQRGRARTSISPPPRCKRRKLCRCIFTGGSGRRLHLRLSAADTEGPPARGEPVCSPESDGLEPVKALILLAHILNPSALRSSKPQIWQLGQHSGSGRGPLHISERETHPSGAEGLEARPRPALYRHRDPPSFSSFSSWEIGGVYGAPGRRLAGRKCHFRATFLPISLNTCTPSTPSLRSQATC